MNLHHPRDELTPPLRKLVLRLLRKYNKAVNYSDGTEAEKHASALALFPADNSGSLEVGLFLQKMIGFFAKDDRFGRIYIGICVKHWELLG